MFIRHRAFSLAIACLALSFAWALACGDSTSDGPAPTTDAGGSLGDGSVLTDGAELANDASACSAAVCPSHPSWCGVHQTMCGSADCGLCRFRQDRLGQ